MRIETTVESFRAALEVSLKPPARVSIPVLQMALIQDSAITATHMDLTTIIPFESTGYAKGLIPVRKALDVLKGESGPLTITWLENNWVRLVTADCEFNLVGANESNVPQAPKAPAYTVTADGAEFKKLIRRTSFAISHEELLKSRYTSNTALLTAGADGIKLIATDGVRLSIAETKAGDGTTKALVPSAALDWIAKHAGSSIDIGAEAEIVAFHTAGKTLLARVVKGQFPNFEAILAGAKQNPVSVALPSADALAKSLTRVAKCADDRSRAVTFSFNDVLEMNAESCGVGKAHAVRIPLGLPQDRGRCAGCRDPAGFNKRRLFRIGKLDLHTDAEADLTFAAPHPR